MVLGLRSGKKGTPVSLVFEITLNEVKPWPSKTLPPLVMIQWQRGEKRTGSSKSVAPEKDKIVINDLFTIPATLYKLAEKKKSGSPRYQKKCIIFSLCEAQQRGQPLGRAVLDLADYGSLDRTAISSIPVAVARKEFSALGTPHLSFTIAPEGRGSGKLASSSSKVHNNSPSNASGSSASGEQQQQQKNTEQEEEEENHASLIAALVSDEEDEEEIAAFTDDEEDDTSIASSSASKATQDQSKQQEQEVNSQQQAAPIPSTPATTAEETSTSGDTQAKNERVQRILSSVGASGGTTKAAAAAAASAYASKKALSSSSFSSSSSPSSPRTVATTTASDQDVQQVPVPKLKPAGGGRDAQKKNVKKVNNVLQTARMLYAEGAGERSERLDKKAVEEARQRAATAEAKASAAQERAQQLEAEMEDLRTELREAAALELALYAVVAQHGSSAHKIHAPARRLARMYVHACKNCSQQARASAARTCACGLVVVVRACENDVPRLTFWWSNVVVLREMISQAFDTSSSAPASPVSTTPPPVSPKSNGMNFVHDWRETATLISTLERIEAWIFGRIVECIWWQSLTPHMQSSAAAEQSVPPSPSDEGSVVSRLKKSVRGLVISDFADSRQGTISIEIWKSAFLDALQRICPVRAGGHDCGCLQVVTKMIIEQCVARLDVAMFNAILRDMEENVPTDPISDPITELSVLPIPPDGVSFGGGAQLKNVINTWSTWLLTLTAEGGSEEAAAAAAQENIEKGTSHFTLLRAMSDLLMLPKDMLMDKSVRKEVCPALSLLLIRRVLSKFMPDEFAPDPVPPSLLAALNAEISMERQRVGEADISSSTVIMASAPPVVYFPPSPALIRNMFSDISKGSPKLTRSASLFRKGHMSDDELEELESPLYLLVDNAGVDPKEPENASFKDALAKRYRLLRSIWT